MTLATNMWVLDPVDIEQLWVVGRALIHANSERSGDANWEDKEADQRWGGKPGQRSRQHHIGQGFCSMYDVDYMTDGSLLHDGSWEHDSEWCEEDCDPAVSHRREQVTHYVAISFDTAYGYRGKNGEGCGDLHSRLVGTIGAWLDTQGVRWSWENEFTGEIHRGTEGLDKLGSGGRDAQAWMLSAVLPALAAGGLS